LTPVGAAYNVPLETRVARVTAGVMPMHALKRPLLLIALLAIAAGAAATTAVWLNAQAPVNAIARFPDGKPNLSGLWQTNNTANWNIAAHPARPGPVAALGAAFSIPGGTGIVEGNEIPYKPEALARKTRNAEQWMTADPEIKCYLPGVPRAVYMPYPFQIVQSSGSNDMLITYEFANASRIVRMNAKAESPIDTWMGWSRGRWEGDTLVVDVSSFNGQSWFDRAGNYQTDKLHVVERYTLASPDVMRYEATIEDPQLYTRPWKISMPIYRRLEKDAQLVEYKCVEFAEELMYGHLVKQPKASSR
jgi:hypothetical protein